MNEVLHLINGMSPFILLGFFLAGLMHAFIPSKLYSNYLSDNSFLSVVRAALLGIPLPLCSCGVIPTAMSLRREGASKGATVSFLIATPQTGIDSIIATYSILGLPFAVLRPIAALCTALLGGALVNRTESDKNRIQCDIVNSESMAVSLSFVEKMKKALHYAFMEMMEDIGKWLCIGLLIAALITLFVPTDFFSVFQGNTLLSMLLVLLLSIPMYLCATGSIPIAAALMLKGLSPGAALVLLMAGPASNVASMLVINKVLGRKTLFIYLGSIIFGAIIFGLAADLLMPQSWFISISNTGIPSASPESCWWGIASSILLALLLLNVLLRKFYRKPSEDLLKSPNKKTHIYQVNGMHCNHCCNNIVKALQNLEGVESVRTELQTQIVSITGKVSDDAVISVIKSLGFEVLPQEKYKN